MHSHVSQSTQGQLRNVKGKGEEEGKGGCQGRGEDK